MSIIARRTPWSICIAATVLAVAGCNRADRRAPAGGEVSRDTLAGRGTPVPAPSSPTYTENVDDAEDRVEAALRADSALGVFRLDADDERGRLVLEGVVATEGQKALAAAVAARMAPGVSVDNRLRVDSAAARRRSADASADEAEDRVEDALDADTTLKAFDLEADDEHGRLVLTGAVRTDAQRRLAEDIAKRIAPGVRVDNRIRVK